MTSSKVIDVQYTGKDSVIVKVNKVSSLKKDIELVKKTLDDCAKNQTYAFKAAQNVISGSLDRIYRQYDQEELLNKLADSYYDQISGV